ncbi:MAG: choice-of-anchor V domain-containing protein [Bryobacter sp.]|nr:choice-of-anchor V domain-containing protein [Bryobacter sp.]
MRLKWFWVTLSGLLVGLPLLLFAYSSGAPARSAGAPGDNTCLRGGCHLGTRTDNSPTLEILWEGGNSYSPGVKQRFTVRVGDPGRRYGFQATARPDSQNLTGQAGTFTGDNRTTYVLCETVDPRPALGCPPNNPVEFITHLQESVSNTFTFEWTPPSTNVGPVTIYVAANSSDGPAPQGAKVHLKSLTLQPGVGSGLPPTISQGGVVSASAFGGGTNVAPGSWIEIFGQNLGPATPTSGTTWEGAFDGNRAPTILSNSQVLIGGIQAPISFVGPNQINAQVPYNLPPGGPLEVRVKTPGGETPASVVSIQTRAPGLLAPASFTRNQRRFVGALFPDGRTFAGTPGLVAGLDFRLPIPGDTLVIYGVGFGNTVPAVAAGTIVSGTPQVPGLSVRIGSQTATTAYAGLAPGFVGLYQFNVVVPNLQAGDHEIVMTVDGVSTQSQLYLSTGN